MLTSHHMITSKCIKLKCKASDLMFSVDHCAFYPFLPVAASVRFNFSPLKHFSSLTELFCGSSNFATLSDTVIIATFRSC